MTDKTLDVDLGDEFLHKLEAIRKFKGRRIRVEDERQGIVEGVNLGYLPLRRFYTLENEGESRILWPNDLNKMTLLEVKEGDEQRISHSYFEVTQRTIDVTKKAAQRYRT